MLKSNYNERVELAVADLRNRADALNRKRISEFGYADRIAIERELFELLKQLCISKLNYQLQGLGDIHREALFSEISSRKSDAQFKRIAQEVFQLRVFMQKMTSDNAYVRSDAFAGAGTTQAEAIKVLSLHLSKIASAFRAELSAG